MDGVQLKRARLLQSRPTGHSRRSVCSSEDPAAEAGLIDVPRRPARVGDRVKTDRRGAERLVRLLAAGGLRFAFVLSVMDEQFRDVIRAVEDCRGDLMRARHRLSAG